VAVNKAHARRVSPIPTRSVISTRLQSRTPRYAGATHFSVFGIRPSTTHGARPLPGCQSLPWIPRAHRFGSSEAWIEHLVCSLRACLRLQMGFATSTVAHRRTPDCESTGTKEATHRKTLLGGATRPFRGERAASPTSLRPSCLLAQFEPGAIAQEAPKYLLIHWISELCDRIA
jgi:hypothetical protein